MTRRLPPLTAECGIGPALGVYVPTAPARHAARAGAIRQMAGTIVRAPDPKKDPEIYSVHQLFKDNPGAYLCPEGLKPCWGKDGTRQEYDYICCDPANEACYQDSKGDPVCQLRLTSKKAICSLPTDVQKIISGYVAS